MLVFNALLPKRTFCRSQAFNVFVLAPIICRQIRNKASPGANWQKRRSSAARIHPATPRITAAKRVKQESLRDANFFVSGGSTVRGVFIPALQHTFK